MARADAKDREALVQSLLELYDQEHLLDFDWNIRETYRKLSHPRLAEQLRPYIVDNSKGVTVRRVAIDIAEECGLKVLEKELIGVALDLSHPQMIRVYAAHAVSEIADEATKLLLKPLALNSGDDDEDDQLKGVALASLWPSQMTADELFTALTPPKRTNLFGLYQAFIASEFVKDILPNDLPSALKWVEKQSVGHDYLSPFSRVFNAIMSRAWTHLEMPDVLNAFARLALKRLEHFDPIVGEMEVGDSKTQQFVDELIRQEDKRHRLLEVMLPLIDDLNKDWVWLISPMPMLLEKDIPWLIMHLKSAPNEEERQKWAFLIEKIAGWSEPTQLDAVISECNGYPSLVQALEKLKADYPEREKLKRKWQPERKVELIKPSPQERIAQLLDQCENKDSAAWWLLNREMSLEPTSKYYSNEFNSDLTALPGWKSSDAKTRERILAAARKFLLEQDPNTPEWLDKSNIVYFPALAGYRALELLLRESPASIATLSPDVWKKWVPVIPTFPNKPSSDDQYYGQLIQLAYRYAPNEMIQTILKIIDQENKAHGSIYIISQMRNCWDDRLSQALLEKLNDVTLKPNSIGGLLHELLDHKLGNAKDFAESCVRLSSSKDETERSKAVVAAQALLSHAEDAGWSTVWPAMQRDTEFGKTVISGVASGLDQFAASVASKITENQIADLYIWLERNYPHAQDPHYEGVHAVDARESIARWRDALLQHIKFRGTNEAVSAMRRIVNEFPELQWLRWALLETRDLTRRGTWIPTRPADIIKLTTSPELRLVQSGDQLLEVVEESLKRLQTKLQAEIPAAQFLWDGSRPKDENAFSDYVALHLDEDLRRRGIIFNREVQIHRQERTDIHVDAISQEPNEEQYRRLSVIVESKGCWNRDLKNAMKTQLVDRYLTDNQCQHGIYLVGWFNCDEWDSRDRRKQIARRLRANQGTLQQYLEKQAVELSQQGIHIRAIVLDAAIRRTKLTTSTTARKRGRHSVSKKNRQANRRDTRKT